MELQFFKASWLSGPQVCHTHDPKFLYYGLPHPDGGKEMQVAYSQFDRRGSSILLLIVFAHTADQADYRSSITSLSVQHHGLAQVNPDLLEPEVFITQEQEVRDTNLGDHSARLQSHDNPFSQ